MIGTVPITVVIPTIGRERLLTECLRSLMNTDPQPADEATRRGATSAHAQSGLGNDARGLTDATEEAFRRALSEAPEAPDPSEKRGSAS